jgi:molybdopterin/thiamine biosynthesis adenylyltransferase
LLPRTQGEAAVTDRQEKLKGFNQEALANAAVLLIGAGGLGGEIGEALVRKGVGKLIIVDFDLVEITNLNRQRFTEQDLGKPKAHRLAAHLATEGFCGTRLQGIALSFQDALQYGITLSSDIAIVGVDNNPCRIAASRYFREQHTPCIFTSVSVDASHGYVFVQEPGKACFACQFPKALNDESYPCGTPAVKDILKVMGGIVSYAVDSLLMERLRTWSYKHVYLCGFPGKDWLVPRKQDCPLCGVRSTEPQAESFATNAMQSEGGRL